VSRAPHYPLEGVASWNMNTTCNYRCAYCTQRFVDDRGQWARDLPRSSRRSRLPGDWEDQAVRAASRSLTPTSSAACGARGRRAAGQRVTNLSARSTS
jgi:hypothetical protein